MYIDQTIWVELNCVLVFGHVCELSQNIGRFSGVDRCIKSMKSKIDGRLEGEILVDEVS